MGLAKGKDLCLHGSGNIGATNVGRIFGTRYFVLVFLLQWTQGGASRARGRPLGPMPRSSRPIGKSICCGWPREFAAVLGHMFCPFLHFKGGKGVATSFGVALGLFPDRTLPGLIGIAVWGIVLAAKRYVLLASITAAVAFLAAYVGIGLLCHWHPFGQRGRC